MVPAWLRAVLAWFRAPSDEARCLNCKQPLSKHAIDTASGSMGAHRCPAPHTTYFSWDKSAN